MSRAVTISSSANPLVKDVRRAVERGELTAAGCCVAETFHLLDEALRSCGVERVLASESARAAVELRLEKHPGVPLTVLPDKLFRDISSTEASQGVAVLVKPRQWTMDDLFRGIPLVLVMDGIQDPGNAGSIVRAAEAFGATGVAFVRGSASPFNPKTLRASAGSLFRVPFVHGVYSAEIGMECVRREIVRYAAVPGAYRNNPDFSAPCALIVGSESHGVSDELRAGATAVSIPMKTVESLNAAVAAGILLYLASQGRNFAG